MSMIISYVQWKGGVGKSTLAVLTAALMDAVLVDLEPWAGATTWWAGRDAARIWQAPGGSPILGALAKARPPKPRRGKAGRPDLIPSHEELLGLSSGDLPNTTTWAWSSSGKPTLLVSTPMGPQPLAESLGTSIKVWAKDWGRDVVIDTPGGFGPLQDAALAACDVAVLPVMLDQWSMPALRKMMETYRHISRGLVVPNRVRQRREDNNWSEIIMDPSVILKPFSLAPPVAESELIHVATRPLNSARVPGAIRAQALGQLQELVACIRGDQL